MTTNPWNIPPHPKKGDASDSVTYEAVGRALSKWEDYESVLARFFSSLIGSASFTATMRAYGTVLTYRGHADMVEAAAEAFFLAHRAPRVQADFASFMNRAGQFAARRNEIAHGRVGKFLTPTRKVDGWCLYPSYFNTKKYELVSTRRRKIVRHLYTREHVRKPKYLYTSVEINAFATAFGDLANDGRKLWDRVSDLYLTPLARRGLRSPESLSEFERAELEARLEVNSRLKKLYKD